MESEGQKDSHHLTKDILSFLHLDSEKSIERFLKMKEIFFVRFHLPEIDFIRDEIGRCYTIGADHACITLTNLLLERYCKLILIYKHSGFKTIQGLKNIEQDFKPAMKIYNSMTLGETLLECKSKE